MGINDIIYKVRQEVNQDLEQKVCLTVRQYADEHGLHNVYTINPKLICEALEKQIPKKPTEEIDDRFIHRLYCSNCGRYFGICGDLKIPTNSKYCCECGQAIDWSEK